MTKKYTMAIRRKDTKETVENYNSNDMRYLRKKWNQFFLTSTGERTTRLLDYTFEVTNNEKSKDVTDEFQFFF